MSTKITPRSINGSTPEPPSTRSKAATSTKPITYKGEKPVTTTFSTFRPRYHFAPRTGWLNDVNIWIDAKTGIYHLFYQQNEPESRWNGNYIAWGHATTRDFLVYYDQPPTVAPSEPYDRLGICSGSALSKGYKGCPTMIYSAVNFLINELRIRYNLYYQPGQEQQALAWSEDGGYTWKKYKDNCVLRMPPVKGETKAFRDPFVTKNARFDRMIAEAEAKRDDSDLVVIPKDCNGDEGYFYMQIGGTYKEDGPRIWLYRTLDFLHWDHLGEFITVPKNYTFRSFETHGSLLRNLEVFSHFSLHDSKGEVIEFGMAGAEMGYGKHEGRVQMWFSGPISLNDSGGVKMTLTHGGKYDCSGSYANFAIFDPVKNRTIVNGWVDEADGLNEDNLVIRPWGWAGVLTIPMELFVHERDNVVDVDGEITAEGPYILAPGTMEGTYRVRTLGWKPIEEVTQLRSHVDPYNLGSNIPVTNTIFPTQTHSKFQEMHLTFQVGPGTKPGVLLRSNPDQSECSILTYDYDTGKLQVDRQKSRVVPPEILTTCDTEWEKHHTFTEEGYFRLYTIRDADGSDHIEPLDLHIYIDNSVVEIFVNERFGMTFRVYPYHNDESICAGLVDHTPGHVKECDRPKMISGKIWSTFECCYANREGMDECGSPYPRKPDYNTLSRAELRKKCAVRAGDGDVLPAGKVEE